jgi:hypothetical protein
MFTDINTKVLLTWLLIPRATVMHSQPAGPVLGGAMVVVMVCYNANYAMAGKIFLDVTRTSVRSQNSAKHFQLFVWCIS